MEFFRHLHTALGLGIKRKSGFPIWILFHTGKDETRLRTQDSGLIVQRMSCDVRQPRVGLDW